MSQEHRQTHIATANCPPFRCSKRLGEGGFGEVYLGKCLRTGKPIAVKRCRKPNVDNDKGLLKKEFEIQVRFDHPNIMKALAYGTYKSRDWMVLEYCGGVTLDSYMRDHPQLPEQVIYDIVKQILAAMTHAHHLGIVHRDLKPENVMVDKTVKIGDWGLAEIMPGRSCAGICGTAPYLSPEMIKGYPYWKEVDVWAFAIMLFQLFQDGRLPFEVPVNADVPAPTKEALQQMLFKLITETDPVFDDDVPRDAKNLIQEYMRKDPNMRMSFAGFDEHAWSRRITGKLGHFMSPQQTAKQHGHSCQLPAPPSALTNGGLHQEAAQGECPRAEEAVQLLLSPEQPPKVHMAIPSVHVAPTVEEETHDTQILQLQRENELGKHEAVPSKGASGQSAKLLSPQEAANARTAMPSVSPTSTLQEGQKLCKHDAASSEGATLSDKGDEPNPQGLVNNASDDEGVRSIPSVDGEVTAQREKEVGKHVAASSEGATLSDEGGEPNPEGPVNNASAARLSSNRIAGVEVVDQIGMAVQSNDLTPPTPGITQAGTVCLLCIRRIAKENRRCHMRHLSYIPSVQA